MKAKHETQKGKDLYDAPKVVVYGNVAEITRQGGSTVVDSPVGTPIGVGAGDLS